MLGLAVPPDGLPCLDEPVKNLSETRDPTEKALTRAGSEVGGSGLWREHMVVVASEPRYYIKLSHVRSALQL